MKDNLRKSNISNFFNEFYIENELNNIINNIDIKFDKYLDIINYLYDVKITNYDIL